MAVGKAVMDTDLFLVAATFLFLLLRAMLGDFALALAILISRHLHRLLATTGKCCLTTALGAAHSAGGDDDGGEMKYTSRESTLSR